MSLPTPTFSRREDVGSELGSPPVDPASLDIRLTSPFLNRSSGNGAAPSLFGGPARAGTPQNRSIPSAPSLFDTPLPTPPPQSSIGFNASSTPLTFSLPPPPSASAFSSSGKFQPVPPLQLGTSFSIPPPPSAASRGFPSQAPDGRNDGSPDLISIAAGALGSHSPRSPRSPRSSLPHPDDSAMIRSPIPLARQPPTVEIPTSGGIHQDSSDFWKNVSSSLSSPRERSRLHLGAPQLLPGPRALEAPRARFESIHKVEESLERRWRFGKKQTICLWLTVAAVILLTTGAIVYMYFMLRQQPSLDVQSNVQVGGNSIVAGDTSIGGSANIATDLRVAKNLVCTSSQLSRVGMGTCTPKTLLDVSGGVTVRAGIPQTVNRGDVGVSFGSNSHGIFLDDNTPTFPFPLSVSSLTSSDRNFVDSSRRSVVDLENMAFRASSSNAAAGLTESSPSSPARSSLSDSDKNEMHSLNTENLFSMNVLVNGVRRAQFYGTSSLPNSLFGPLDVRGQTIRLGTTLPRLALADNGAGLLQINHVGQYHQGIVFGPTHLRLDGEGRLVVGNVSNMISTVRVFGSIRAKKGLPSSLDSSNVGFSFADDRDTGLFASLESTPLSGSSMSLIVDSITRLTIPPLLSSPVTIVQNLSVTGFTLFLGNSIPLRQALHVRGSLLVLNQGGDYSQGLMIGVDRLHVRNSGLVTIGSFGESQSALHVKGGIRTGSGKPNPSVPSGTFNRGYSFDEDSTTGLFTQGIPAQSLSLFVRGQERVNIQHSPVRNVFVDGNTIVNGSITVNPGSLLFGPAAYRSLHRVQDRLHVNFMNDFRDGMVLGDNQVLIRRVPGATISNRVGIQTLQPTGTLDVRGGIRALHGAPSLNRSTSDVGYAFAPDLANTGMFFTGTTSSHQLAFYVNSVLKVESPAAGPVRIFDNLELRGSVFRLSSTNGIAFQASEHSLQRLLINPTEDFSGGVIFGRHQLFLRRYSDGVSRLVVNNATLLPEASLEVGGGIRVSMGIPSGPTSNSGFSFLGDGDTGMFLKGGSIKSLKFLVDGFERLSFPAQNAQGLGFEFNGNLSISGNLVVRISDLVVLDHPGAAIPRRVGIRTSSPRASLEVAGGIRARKGLPTSGPIHSDVGYSFQDSATSGLFFSGMGANHDISIFSNNLLRVHIPEADVIEVTDSLRILGRFLHLGSSSAKRALGTNSLASQLFLNLDNVYSSGTLFGDNQVLIRRSTPPGSLISRAHVLVNNVTRIPEAAIEVSGGVRVSKGVPAVGLSRPDHHFGFAFESDGSDTGMFSTGIASQASLRFFVDGTERITSPKLLDEYIVLRGDARIEDDFLVGTDHLFVQRYSSGVLQRVGINTNTPNSALEVAGGIRARRGVPGGLFDLGYSFQDAPLTGLFFSSTLPNHQLTLFVNGSVRIQVPTTGYIDIRDSIRVRGAQIRLGNPVEKLALAAVPSPVDELVLNELNEFSGGIRFGLNLMHVFMAGGQGFVGINGINKASQQATLEVGGGVSAAVGIPSVGNVPHNFGFSFLGGNRYNTGLFSDGTNNTARLSLMVEGIERLSIPKFRSSPVVVSGQLTVLEQLFVLDQSFVVRRYTSGPLTRVGISTSDPGSSLDVNGGIRANPGAPIAPPSEATTNVGFAFRGSPSTGLFLTGTLPDDSMTLSTSSVARIVITSSGALRLMDSVSVFGLHVNLGPTPRSALSTTVANNLLVLNTENVFNLGVRIGTNHLFIRNTTGWVQMGINGIVPSSTGSSLEVNGGVRSLRGIPSSLNQPHNLGYAFLGDGARADSGMFASGSGSGTNLVFLVDGAERFRFPRVSTAILTGNLTITAGELSLGPEGDRRRALVRSGSLLRINDGNTFPNGVMFGLDYALLSFDSVSGKPRFSVGTTSHQGTIRAAGSVRSAAGKPVHNVPNNGLDVGFAFDGDGDTGLFSTTAHLGMFIDAKPMILMYPSLIVFNNTIRSTGIFELQNDLFRFGFHLDEAMRVLYELGGMRSLSLNGQNQFLSGVKIGASASNRYVHVREVAGKLHTTIGTTSNPVGSLEVGGGVRASLGFPSLDESTSSDFGYSFLTKGRTGMFSHSFPSNPQLSFLVDGFRRLDLTRSFSPSLPAILHGSFRLNGSEFQMGTTGSLKAFVHVPSPTEDTLHINRLRGFTGGVVIGDDVIIRQLGSPTLTTRVGIRSLTPRSALDVNGGVRSATGYPGSSSSDVGFSFGQFGNTGMFSVAQNISFLVNGIPKLDVPLSSAVQVRGPFDVLGNEIRFGAPSLRLFARKVDISINRQVQINPTNEFEAGVVIGSVVNNRHLHVQQVSNHVFVGIGMSYGYNPASALEVTGSSRVSWGYPASGSLGGGGGYAFLNDPTSGMFGFGGSNARVEIYSQSIRRLTLTNSLTSSRPAILNGSFQIGSNGQLQMDSTSRIALVRVSEHLHINRQKGFTDGVIIGEDVIIQHVGSAPVTRLGVGLLNPSGSIESSGGVRAAKGVPGGGSGNGYDRGFSFASDGDTGIFASTSSPTFLSATIDGTEILRLQSSGLELTRDDIFLGSPSPGLLGFQVTGTLPTRTLHINPTYAYTGGVTIGRIAFDSRRISIFEDGSNSLRVAVGTSGVPGGTIDVLGGIRSTVGIPLSNDANMGYAFIGDGDTGLFSDASGLYLYRDSSVRITIPHTGTNPLILHSNVRMMGDTLTLFSTFEALKSVANVLEVGNGYVDGIRVLRLTSSGGIHSSKGIPDGGANTDRGYGFRDGRNTGMFVIGTAIADHDLGLYTNGVLRVTIPQSTSVLIHAGLNVLGGPLSIQNAELNFGDPLKLTLRDTDESGPRRLEINPSNAYAAGVTIGHTTSPRHIRVLESGGRARLGVAVSSPWVPIGTVENTGGYRAGIGLSNSNTDDFGFSFMNAGATGMFAATGTPPSLHFKINNDERLRLVESTLPANPSIIYGSLLLDGSNRELQLGSTARRALVSFDIAGVQRLQISPANAFAEGVSILDNFLVKRFDVSGSLLTRVGINTNDPSASFEVVGGIRAAKGDPAAPNPNTGFAFGSDGQTGMFVPVGTSRLEFRSLNTLYVLVPESTTSNVEVTTSLNIFGSSLFMSPSRRRAIRIDGADSLSMRINPEGISTDGSFKNGVSIGDATQPSTRVLIRNYETDVSLRVGIGVDEGQLTDSLEVNGGSRILSGNPGSNAGYAFRSSRDTGMFSEASPRRLHFFVENVKRMEMSSSLLDTSPVLVFGSLSLSGNILRLGSSAHRALSISGSALHINEDRQFTAVNIHTDVIIRTSGSGNTQMGVGIVNPVGRIESSGGIRSQVGVPSAANVNFDVGGFSFLGAGDTGLFFESGVLSLRIGSVSRFSMTATTMTFSVDRLDLTGNLFFMGTPLKNSIEIVGGTQMNLNAENAYSGGVIVGSKSGGVGLRVFMQEMSGAIRMGIGASPVATTVLTVAGSTWGTSYQAAKSVPSTPDDVFNSGGYSFSGDGDTGLFASSSAPTILHLMRDSVSLMDFSSTAIHARLNDLFLGTSSRLAFRSSSSAPLRLQINPSSSGSDFSDGVSIGDTAQAASLARFVGVSGAMRFGVGIDSPSSSVDVNGGVRALSGNPTAPGSNVGYAFQSDGGTGYFHITSPSKQLQMYIDSILYSSLSSSTVSFAVNDFLFGPGSPPSVAIRRPSANNRLDINPTNAFVEGVFIGGSTTVERTHFITSGIARVGIGRSPATASLEIAGGVRAVVGPPSGGSNNIDSNTGFTFVGLGHTGMFESTNKVVFFNRNLLRLELSETNAENDPSILHGSLRLSGTALSLGSRLAIRENADILHINPGRAFPGGVRIHEDIVIEHRDATPRPVVGIGKSSGLIATLEVNGGFRALVGNPVDVNSNFGYSFDSRGHTGLFADAGSPSTLTLMIAGASMITMIPSSRIEIRQNLDIVSNVIRLGSGGAFPKKFVEALTGSDILNLNPENQFSSGTVIGNNGVTSSRALFVQRSGGGMSLVIGSLGASAESSIEVEGSVRALSGNPSGSTSNVGYAFRTEGHTGLFYDSGTPRTLKLTIQGTDRISVTADQCQVRTRTFQLGENLKNTFFVDAAEDNRLVINPGNAYTAGVRIGASSSYALVTTRSGGGVSFRLGDVSTSPGTSTFETMSGLAAGIGTSNADRGYHFVESRGSGLFMNDGGNAVLLRLSSTNILELGSSISVFFSNLEIRSNTPTLSLGPSGSVKEALAYVDTGNTLSISRSRVFPRVRIHEGVSMINCQTGRTCSGFMIDNPETTIQVNGGVRVSDGGPGGSTDVGYSFTGTSGSSSGLYYNPDSSVGLNLRFNGNIGLRLVSGAVFSVTAFYVPSFSASPAAHPSTQSGFVTFYGLGSDPYFLAASGGPKQLEVVTPSDLQLKKSIHPISSPLDRVMKLSGVEFEWNDLGVGVGAGPRGVRETGLIAQEIEMYLPEALGSSVPISDHVEENVDGISSYKTVRYGRVVPLLLEALKEEHQARQELEDRVAMLEEIVRRLSDRLK